MENIQEKMKSMTSTLPAYTENESITPTKKRFEWIDNARVVALFVIMWLHVPFGLFPETWEFMLRETAFIRETFFYAYVPFFLFLSGYFTARNITWHKAFDRFLWLLIPYILWNLSVGYVCCGLLPNSPESACVILGIKDIFSPHWTVCAAGAGMPVDMPTWFLRDMLILSLLTPIIVKFKKWLPLLIVLYFSCHCLRTPVFINGGVLLAPGQVMYYLLGVCVSHRKLDEAYRLFNHPRMNAYMLLAFLYMLVILGLKYCMPDKGLNLTCVSVLLGIAMIAYSGVLIERYFPRLSHRLAPCGPASFLIFVMHWPLFLIVHSCLPECMIGSPLLWLVPIPTFFIIIYTFFGIKKFAPWLMPYLCHMKLQAIKDEKIRLMNYKKQDAANTVG